jgi:hypothetical protein
VKAAKYSIGACLFLTSMILSGLVPLTALSAPKPPQKLLVEGSWKTDCLSSGPTLSSRDSFELNDDIVSEKREYFSDSLCKQPEISQGWSGKVIARTDSRRFGLADLTFRVLDLSVAPSSPHSADKFNAEKTCGQTGWSAAQSKLLAHCDAFDLPTAGTKIHHSVKWVSNHELVFSDTMHSSRTFKKAE